MPTVRVNNMKIRLVSKTLSPTPTAPLQEPNVLRGTLINQTTGSIDQYCQVVYKYRLWYHINLRTSVKITFDWYIIWT